MDAVEFLKAWKRMCKTTECVNCKAIDCCHFIIDIDKPEKLLNVVEEWTKEHIKTRQSKLLKILPNVRTKVVDDTEVVAICPSDADKTFVRQDCTEYSCYKCEKEYWLQEV